MLLSGDMARGSCSLPKKTRGIGLWLVGGTTPTISTGCKLPSNFLWQRFFHLHNIESQTISASSTATMKEVFWDKARIQIHQNFHIITKIKHLHSEWIGIKMNVAYLAEQTCRRKMFAGSVWPCACWSSNYDKATWRQIIPPWQAHREKWRRGRAWVRFTGCWYKMKKTSLTAVGERNTHDKWDWADATSG